MSKIALPLLIALSLVFRGAGADPPDSNTGQIELTLGQPYVGDLSVGVSSKGVRTFFVEVPEDALQLDLELACRRTNLDLYAWHLSLEESGEAASTLTYGRDRLVFDRFTEPPLGEGRYEISVEFAGDKQPSWNGEGLTRVEFTLTAKVVMQRIDAILEPGVPFESEIDPALGRFRSFVIDVPEDAPALRIDIPSTQGDVDLLARRGKPIARIEQVTHSAEHYYGRESLVITAQSQPRLRPGKWYVDVVDYGFHDEPSVPFTVLAGFDPAPPPGLLELPALNRPTPGRPLSAAICAVVEVYAGESGGSGTLVTESGVILTNAHVVSDFADQALEEVVIAATFDTGRPAVELFRARVVRFDWERDLALLEIESGLYGQALPASYTFPVVPLGEADALDFGDNLWFVGYPWTGGLGGRVSITATRGMVCGFESGRFGKWIKTDAEIAEGNSGGAALNAEGQVIGVPTSIMEGTASQLSYIVPVTAIPAEWRGGLEGHARR